MQFRSRALGILLLAVAIGGTVLFYRTWFGGFAVAETRGANKQKPGLNIGFQNVRDYFSPDMELEDIKWEAFGTPDWAPDRMEMWPTDYVSLVLTGRASANAIAEKFSRHTDQVAVPSNSARAWLPSSMQKLMQDIITEKPIPSNIRCRELPASVDRKYESGFSCTDGEQVLYFLLLQSLAS